MKRRVIVAGTALLTLVVALSIVGWWAWGALFRPVDPSSTEEVVFDIAPGQGLRTVAANLEAAGLVTNARILEVYARAEGLAARLQAGRYVLAPAQTPVEMLGRIVSGDAVFDEITITIPEGWSLNDIEQMFAAMGLFSVERFAEAAVMQEAYRDIAILAALEDDTILDGYLFPDTYRIFPTSTPESIMRRMLMTFEQRIDSDLLADIEAQGRTLHEILTLASIVQGEAGTDGEMPDVAGVFWKRLQEGIRLESDATVNYVLGTSKRQPTFADTEVQHPYNTYENFGLPPGPIGNPGLAAIRATVYPADNPFYFFLHKPDGEIVLSRTFADHLAAKARYLD